ncbi:hypothetical protein [Streptomyces caelestis]|uniref:hypothetical protein n=1 Tax=Streptomyces caelestis TaxID=36816 RepID=UPI00364EF320
MCRRIKLLEQENEVLSRVAAYPSRASPPGKGSTGSGLRPESVGDIAPCAGERAGIGIRFTGRSPRRGLATSFRMKGHDRIVIAQQGGRAPHSEVLGGPPRCARGFDVPGYQRSAAERGVVHVKSWRISRPERRR